MVDQSFLRSKIGDVIQFINPIGRQNEITVTPTNIEKLYKLQRDGYQFLKPTPIIHVSSSVCESCEG